MPKSRKVRYAVVGLGHIAQAAVLPAFEHAKRNSKLVALVSGTPKKLKELGKRYRVAHLHSYDDFDDAVDSGEFDAVYLALPNHLHHEFAVRAAQAGVHVLCEKPLAVTERECQEMMEVALRKGVLLMTAYRLHFERTNLEAIEAVRSGKIGEPRIVEASFTMQVREGNVRLESEVRGGGPLYDLGIYCINAARALFRDEPLEVVGMEASSDDARFEDCHEMVAATLRFPGERLASFVCSFGAAPTARLRVIGTKGDVEIESAFEIAEPMKEHLTVDEDTKTRRFGKRDQFAPELLHFSDCILDDTMPEPSGREGWADVRVIRAILRSVDEGRAIRLPPAERARRPTMELEAHRPPVKRRKLVAVESASH